MKAIHDFMLDHWPALTRICVNSLLGWWGYVTLDNLIKVAVLCLTVTQLVLLLKKEVFNRRTRRGNQTGPGATGTGHRDGWPARRPLESGEQGDHEDHGTSERPGATK